MYEQQEQPIHVLIVDDDLEGAYMLGEALQASFDFQITRAASGPDALQMVATWPQRFDVALVDQNLDPRMDGIQVVRELFQLNSMLPVILFTGLELQPDHLRAIEGGASLYLHVQKGDVPINQLGFHCQAAARDRVVRWHALSQEVSQALHSLDVDEVLDACVAGLARLGYTSGAIYRRVKGWVVSGLSADDGFRPAEQRSYLYRERTFAGSAFDEAIDLSEHSDIQNVLESGTKVWRHIIDDGREQVLIPLRADNKLEPASDALLGLIVLQHLPFHGPEPREESNLGILGQQVALALQNALAYRQREYHSAMLSQILETSQRILALETGVGDMTSMLDQFAQAIAQSLKFQRVAISIVNETEGVIEIRGLAGLTAEELQDIRCVRISRSVFESLHKPEYRHGNSYFIPEGSYDFDQYQGFIMRNESLTAWPWHWHGGDMLRTQIVNSQGKILGYISVDERINQRRPDTVTFTALDIFATQVALGIENLTYQRTIEAIQQVAIKISSTRSREILFTTVHEQLRQLMSAEVMVIGRYHWERGELSVLYRKKLIPEEEGIPNTRSALLGLMGYVARTGKPLLFEHGTQDFHIRNHIPPLGSYARSWMGVPLRADDEVIGVIALKDYRCDSVYDQRDQRLLTILADQIAVALRKIELEENQLDTFSAVGLELTNASFKLKRVEKLILEWACKHTGAEYGMILHYDEKDDSLMFNEGYVSQPQLASRVRPFFTPGLRLPLHPKPGERGSLSIEVALTRKGKHWGDVRQEQNYLEVFNTSKSQLSLPLLIRDSKQKLLGVLTLESSQYNGFGGLDKNFLNAMSRFASLAVMRAQEQERNDLLLGWGMYDLSSNILRHHRLTRMRTLLNQLTYTADLFADLFVDLKELHAQASLLQPASAIQLDQRNPIRLNDVVRNFVRSHLPLYRHPNVQVECVLGLSDQQYIGAHELGVREMLRILVENAFEILSTTAYGGHIAIRTDEDADGIILRVFNSGTLLSNDIMEFLRCGDVGRDASGHGLGRLRLLLALYRASIQILQNDSEGVELEVRFPLPILEPTPREIDISSRDLYHLQRSIASDSALSFARDVHQRGLKLRQTFQDLAKRLGRTREQVAALAADLSSNLDKPRPLNIQSMLDEFAHDLTELRGDGNPKVPIEYKACLDGNETVNANPAGLRHVLTILVDNAEHAINTQQFKSSRRGSPAGAPTIKISAEAKEKWVEVHVHNTGSVIPRDIADQLFKYPIVRDRTSSKGLGLLMSKVLLAKYDGSILLTRNSRRMGVQFTIQLSRVVDARAR